MTLTPAEACSGRAGRPRVVVAVAHRGMQRLIVELLNRDLDAWVVSAVDSVSDLDHAASPKADLLIVDTGDFPAVRRQLPPNFTLARIVVIGPEPDPAYRLAALRRGAGAWLSRDRVAEDLCGALRSVLATLIAPASDRRRAGPPHFAEKDSDD